MSHLLQMRGLKPVTHFKDILKVQSHLLQMRGLKRDFCYTFTLFEQVASFTDAWIETVPPADVAGPIMSHLLQMRGLKRKIGDIKSSLKCRIFYRCVD